MENLIRRIGSLIAFGALITPIGCSVNGREGVKLEEIEGVLFNK